jgi:hypothetical protein
MLLAIFLPLLMVAVAVFLVWRLWHIGDPPRKVRTLRDDFRHVIMRSYTNEELAAIKELTDCYREWR